MMAKRINFEVKEKMVSLAGTCFWFWNSFYSFLDSCGVPKSLQNRFPKEAFNKYQVMRNILSKLEENNQVDTINNIISNFYRLKQPVDKDYLDCKKALQLLDEFRKLVGSDPIEEEIKKREKKKAKQNYQKTINEKITYTKKLEELNAQFARLAALTELTPQQRGFKLEELFFDLLQLNEFEYSKPYRTPDGEQIDGHFRYEKFDYLVEVKWTDGLTKQKDLSIFDGKIRGKAQSTRGLFLSANGFDDNAVAKFSGDSPRIILMTGTDLSIILSDQISFHDAMKAKVDAIVRFGNILYPFKT